MLHFLMTFYNVDRNEDAPEEPQQQQQRGQQGGIPESGLCENSEFVNPDC